MNESGKKIIKNGLVIAKKVAKSNRLSHKAALNAKKAILLAINDNSPREIYNLTSFYPTIQEYYMQTKDRAKDNPMISILMPTYNTPEAYLRECIESIIVQSYPNWELCIADDNSTDKQVLEIINEYEHQDDRIKLIKRPTNGHISEATNSALKIAKGDFVALMDHDDILWPNALYEIIKVIREDKNIDFIYTDEDKIDGTGKTHSYPFLKPDFSPEFLESCNYITHFSCIRRSVIEEIGGFRKGYEGAQDWDLFIRITENTNRIFHIPKILYSWRIHSTSTASDTDAKPYVYAAQKKLLVDHLSRTKHEGSVETGIIKQHRTIKYMIVGTPKIMVVVSFSALDDYKQVISSMTSHPAGVSYTILCVSDNLISDSDIKTIKQLYPSFVIEYLHIQKKDEQGMYSYIADHYNADYFIFIDSQIEIISDDWAKTLVADCQLSGVGIVGPVLLDATTKNIYSAGIGIGYGKEGFMDMLKDMPFDDPHYSRGLYAKSRRNVSAVNFLLFAVSKESILLGGQTKSALDLCLSLLQKNKRNIYNPYVQAIVNENATTKIISVDRITEDRYLNPNFNHTNSRMEVRP